MIKGENEKLKVLIANGGVEDLYFILFFTRQNPLRISNLRTALGLINRAREMRIL